MNEDLILYQEGTDKEDLNDILFECMRNVLDYLEEE